MTTRFNSIDENLHEIKHLLLQELKGKEVERITPSPSIMQEHPLFSHGMGRVIREKFQPQLLHVYQQFPPPPMINEVEMRYGKTTRVQPPKYTDTKIGWCWQNHLF